MILYVRARVGVCASERDINQHDVVQRVLHGPNMYVLRVVAFSDRVFMSKRECLTYVYACSRVYLRVIS